MNEQIDGAFLVDTSPIGDIEWLRKETGWKNSKISRLCRLGVIKGSFQAQPGKRGAMWHFRKSKTMAWLESLEIK